jgi:hypothetical protein
MPSRLKLGENAMAELAQGTDKARIAEQWQGFAMWSSPALTAWSETGGAYLKGCTEWQQELSRFFGARIDADITAQHSLAECRSLADATKLQQDWAAATVSDYCIEANRLMAIASHCMQAKPAIAEETTVTKQDEPYRARTAS